MQWKKRLGYVDGLRGCAVLAVVFFHTLLWAEVPRTNLLFQLFQAGRAGVDVFLAISGFCLFYPLLSADGGVVELDRRQFLRRRFRRIAPPFYAALALVMATSAVAYSSVPARSSKLQVMFPFDVGRFAADLALHLSMLHGWSNKFAHSFDGAFWSISLEWQFYLLFIPLAGYARRSLRGALVLPVVVSVGYRVAAWLIYPKLLQTYPGDEMPFGRWLQFAAGMAAAVQASRHPHALEPSAAGRQELVTGARALRIPDLWLYGAIAAAVAAEAAFGYHPAVSPFTWAAAAYALLRLASAAEQPVSRLATSRPAVWLGRISYSLYLTHGAMFMLLATACELWCPSWRAPVVLCAGPLAAVGGGAAFFWLVERHFLPDSLKAVTAVGARRVRDTGRLVEQK